MVTEQIMEKERRSKIYTQIQREVNVSEIKRYYYCANINYLILIDKLCKKHPDVKIMVRVDHVVISTLSKTDEDVPMYNVEHYSSSISCRLYSISSWNDIE